MDKDTGETKIVRLGRPISFDASVPYRGVLGNLYEKHAVLISASPWCGHASCIGVGRCALDSITLSPISIASNSIALPEMSSLVAPSPPREPPCADPSAHRRVRQLEAEVKALKTKSTKRGRKARIRFEHALEGKNKRIAELEGQLQEWRLWDAFGGEECPPVKPDWFGKS